MGKHRQNKHYRRIVIAAVAVGTVAVPSVAMACGDWQDSGGHRSYDWERNGAKDWRHGHDRHTPTPSADTRRTHAPKPKPKKTTTPSRTANTAKPKATPKPKPKKTTPSSTPKATATASGANTRIVELVNAERKKAGCSPVTPDATLTKAAQAHSEDMAAHRNMSHTGSDGSSPGDRITRAGYTWRTYGENVAYGYTTPEQVMAGWMSSPGHKANILNCAFKEIGVGRAQPGNYWTQDFATAR
ncbi:CAP domain-containing protein [Streptomyces spongiae]|uniref:CAP domain-containing protein n=1 Tax=Streptomyces spongiae TaxID=565072 RepID=A0A5N8XB55_9ACTN|nr:CAP domain-containing protein [Streptomyces spongiae]MPY55765.1 CAP domain-containing protein [Streptomyces spongiae]